MKNKTTTKKEPQKATKPLVFVGMSGGVDSSVSAALLKEAGFDVVGVFIRVWSPDWIPCDWREERRDAMRVAATLEIPLLTLNLEKEYKEEVVDYMIKEYSAGRVPNPDVMCNKSVKFGGFFNEAMSMGADFVATGHYARVEERGSKSSLLAGKDEDKDQSYFLWNLNQKHLTKTKFPIGDLKKDEVRKLARKFGLPTATKKDSQGICFLGKVEMKDFLKKYIKTKKGIVKNEKGEKIGTHDGVPFYTIGERHGFVVENKDPNDEPYYIIKKNSKNNTLIVSHNKNEGDSTRREISINDTNWTEGAAPEKGKKYLARIRYREKLKECKIKNITTAKVTVIFDDPEESVASGQSLVLYEGERCLGGGVII